MSVIIRKAQKSDLTRLLQIYAYYVENTAISFEYDAPTIEEFTARFESISAFYPYIVAEDNGQIVGYAYAHRFHERKAFDPCVELTVYTDASMRKRGIGKALYLDMERTLKQMNITNLYACIAVTDSPDEYLTNNSIEFHYHMGFELVGTFRKSGYKFGRWYDMAWVEKFIGEHQCPNPKIKSVYEI